MWNVRKWRTAREGALLHGKETYCYTIRFITNGGDYDDVVLMVINALIDMLLDYIAWVGKILSLYD